MDHWVRYEEAAVAERRRDAGRFFGDRGGSYGDRGGLYGTRNERPRVIFLDPQHTEEVGSKNNETPKGGQTL